MDVVAEGVETEGQRAQLRDFECEFGQGYFFSRPMDVDAAEALLLTCFPHDGIENQVMDCGAPPLHDTAVSASAVGEVVKL
jgi:predicted signal transduction protein with EAL and GGDEF domain